MGVLSLVKSYRSHLVRMISKIWARLSLITICFHWQMVKGTADAISFAFCKVVVSVGYKRLLGFVAVGYFLYLSCCRRCLDLRFFFGIRYK